MPFSPALLAAGAFIVGWAVMWVVRRVTAKPDEPGSSESPPAAALKDDQAATFQAAAAGIRDAAKWMLGAFGAVGALLVAGIHFGGLGKLEGTARWVALGGAAIGLIGVMLAVVGVTSLLRPRAWTLSELEGAAPSDPAREALGTKRELLSGYPSVEALWTDYHAALTRYGTALRAWAAATGEARTKAEAVATLAAQDIGPFAGISRRVLMWANHFSLVADFRRVQRRYILPGAAIALIGLVIFTIQTSSPAPPVGPNLAKLTLPAGTDLTGASLRAADLSGATLVEVTLRSVDLSDAKLTEAILTGADLSGANLRGADLTGARLEGVDWSSTTCPDGTLSTNAGETCVAHLVAPDTP
jgi:hypothetical protein